MVSIRHIEVLDQQAIRPLSLRAGDAEAELTDGQSWALSGHRTQRAYEGYAKRSLARALPATRERRAHALANFQGISIQNAPLPAVQNEIKSDGTAIA